MEWVAGAKHSDCGVCRWGDFDHCTLRATQSTVAYSGRASGTVDDLKIHGHWEMFEVGPV